VDAAIAKVEGLLRSEGADMREFELAAPAWPLQRGRLDEAAPLIDRARTLADPTDPYDAFGLADQLMHLRDYDAVLRVIGGVRKRAWRKAELVFDIGVVHAKALLSLGRFGEVMSALDPVRSANVAKAEPINASAFAQAAALFAVLGDAQEAVRLADDTLGLVRDAELDALDTMWVSAHVARAMLHQPERADTASQLATSAYDTADRFDQRNDSGYLRRQVDQVLKLPPAEVGNQAAKAEIGRLHGISDRPGGEP
jgi:tetratricopeptide (TPR) repeat protein